METSIGGLRRRSPALQRLVLPRLQCVLPPAKISPSKMPLAKAQRRKASRGAPFFFAFPLCAFAPLRETFPMDRNSDPRATPGTGWSRSKTARVSCSRTATTL